MFGIENGDEVKRMNNATVAAMRALVNCIDATDEGFSSMVSRCNDTASELMGTKSLLSARTDEVVARDKTIADKDREIRNLKSNIALWDVDNKKRIEENQDLKYDNESILLMLDEERAIGTKLRRDKNQLLTIIQKTTKKGALTARDIYVEYKAYLKAARKATK